MGDQGLIELIEFRLPEAQPVDGSFVRCILGRLRVSRDELLDAFAPGGQDEQLFLLGNGFRYFQQCIVPGQTG